LPIVAREIVDISFVKCRKERELCAEKNPHKLKQRVTKEKAKRVTREESRSFFLPIRERAWSHVFFFVGNKISIFDIPG
jgi:hypothetical protein